MFPTSSIKSEVFFRSMDSTKFDIDKFMGRNYFGLWRINMRAILVQQGCLSVLGDKKGLSSNLSNKQKV